jgi:hypothetical protein
MSRIAERNRSRDLKAGSARAASSLYIGGVSDVDTVLGRTATATKSALGRAVEISPAEGMIWAL